jgi:hypothetical protein
LARKVAGAQRFWSNVHNGRLAVRPSGNMGGMAPDEFDGNSPLTPEEQLDSDEIRNDDGDEVVDPPQRWIDPEERDSLDERLAEEVPDVQPGQIDLRDADDARGDTVLESDDDLDRIDPDVHGRREGQIDGTPEDGESFFDVQK